MQDYGAGVDLGRLKKSLEKRLGELSVAEGRNVSDIVEDAVDIYLALDRALDRALATNPRPRALASPSP